MHLPRPLPTLVAALSAVFFAAAPLPADQPVSLAGEWTFRLDDQKVGAREKWFSAPLAGETRIKLPGTMDDAGLGPKNTKAPTLEGPYRLHDYAGAAWYQREIDIPAGWQGRRITLFLERCRWVTNVWLDDKLIGSQDSLVTPHVYDFGTGVAPGKHRLTICVDNTVKINLGKFVSALFGGTWGNMNGIVGRIELSATPPVWIDDVRVFPQLKRKCVLVKGKIGNATGQSGNGNVDLQVHVQFDAIETKNHRLAVSWKADGGTFEAELPIADAGVPVMYWDEFSPKRYELMVAINNHSERKEVTFGFREFGVQGTQFTMNGRPVYLRGTLECSIWPLTGYPPMEEGPWRRIYQIMKSYGLNHIRFHSWCPPEAAFAAADEEGIMIQVEAPQANVPAGKEPARDAFTEAELLRIVRTYGNHPSFCTMTLGNEYGGDNALLSRWIDMLKKEDPRHQYSSASSAQKTANRQWTEEANGRGIHGPGSDRDLRGVVASDGRPIIGHEIGQWMYWPDFNEIKKWTGVMALRNFEMIRDDMAKHHVLEQAPKFVEASGRFATLLYKEEIEVLLRTPGYAGFSLLDLHDYPTQGTALIGPLDAFWDSKGFITPEQFRRYCGPTVPLARLAKRTFTADETLEAAVDLAHYGPADMDNVAAAWTIIDAQGKEIAAGTLPAVKAPTGKLTALGTIRGSLAKAAAPCKLKLTVALPGTGVSNDWELWVYPPRVEAAAPNGVTVCDTWADAKAALDKGEKVLYFAFPAKSDLTLAGRFLPVFWSPVWFPTQKPNTMGLLLDPGHPLFAQFPTEGYSNWQWYDLMNRSRLFILDDAPVGFPIPLQVMDNFSRNHRLGVIFEARAGKGQLLVCGLELKGIAAKSPAARQMLASLYAYAGSNKFAPTAELPATMLENLFARAGAAHKSTLAQWGAKVLSADSEDKEHGNFAANAIDGNPDSIWHTGWTTDKTDPMPHTLVIDIGKEVALKGLTYLPRQDLTNGRIAQYEVYCAKDPKDWPAKPAAAGKLHNNDTLQTIPFARPVTARYIKFVAKSEVKGKPFASVAELDIVTEK